MTPMFPTLDAAANVRITQDGYMSATPRVARAGVDPYTAGEIERYTGRRFDRDVRVYVPPEELFALATMRSLADCTITLGHPPEKINARNWRNHVVGLTGGRGDVLQDGEHLRVGIVITDAAAVAAVQGGQRELSPGRSGIRVHRRCFTAGRALRRHQAPPLRQPCRNRRPRPRRAFPQDWRSQYEQRHL
jgi:hypothetical protein